MDSIALIFITIFIITVILVIVVLNLIQANKNKNFKKIIEKLEYEKNLIEGSPIVPELAKVEAYLTNGKLEIMYNDWK